MVGYVRRNFLVPIPSFKSFEALNAYAELRWRGWTPDSWARRKP